MDYKIILGISAIGVGVIAYIPYIKSIFWGRTKPHSFAWLIWTLEQTIAFFAQFAKGAGSGAWVTGLTAFLCLLVFIISLRLGEKNITIIDTASFIGALFAIGAWIITKNPLVAVILVVIIDFLAYVPTFRKAYIKPQEEAVTLYAMYIAVWFLSLLALKSYNLTTVLYPAFLLFINTAFVIMSVTRSRFYNKTSSI